MPGASQVFLISYQLSFLMTAGRAVGPGTRNLGESWGVVMRLIMQVIDRLARTTALPVLIQKIKSGDVGDVMVEGSFGHGDCEIIEF